MCVNVRWRRSAKYIRKCKIYAFLFSSDSDFLESVHPNALLILKPVLLSIPSTTLRAPLPNPCFPSLYLSPSMPSAMLVCATLVRLISPTRGAYLPSRSSTQPPTRPAVRGRKYANAPIKDSGGKRNRTGSERARTTTDAVSVDTPV